MEEQTEKYLNEYKNVLEQRRLIGEEHEEKMKREMLRKSTWKIEYIFEGKIFEKGENVEWIVEKFYNCEWKE